MRLLGTFVVCCTFAGGSVAAQAAFESPFENVGTSSRDSLQRLSVYQAATVLTAGTPAKAQSSAVRFAKLLLPTTLGAMAGSLGGYHAGDAVGFGGTESDGLQSAVLLGTGVGMIGAAGASYLVMRNEITPGQLVNGVAIGALGGILGGVIAGQASGGDWDGTGVWLGFSLGQGIITSFILSQVAAN